MKARSLNFKFGCVVAILIAGAVTISFIGLDKMKLLKTTINTLIDGNVERTLIVKDIRSLLDTQTIDQRNAILEETQDGIVQIKKRMDERHETIKKSVAKFNGIANEIGQREIGEIQDNYLKWWDVTEAIVDRAMKNDDKGAFELAKTKALPLRNLINDKMTSMVERQSKMMESESAGMEEVYSQARTLVIIVSCASTLAGLAIAFLVLASLGKAINRIITDLSGSTDLVSVASQQIASTSEQLSEASTEQAASLEETVSTLEELTSMVKLNSDHAKEAARLSESTRDVATRGESEIRQLVGSMEEISRDSKKIEEIINVIDDIAFQTNLLALNAAVEAARAGEQGKGFSVVADAVRTLAQKSADAAKDIAGLIKGSVAKIENGTQQVGQSGKILEEILASVQKVSGINAEIAVANEEQTNGIMQISKAMNQLDQVTQVNAATSEEAAASAQELSGQAHQLHQVVELLTVTIRGGGHEEGKAPQKTEVRKKKITAPQKDEELSKAA